MEPGTRSGRWSSQGAGAPLPTQRSPRPILWSSGTAHSQGLGTACSSSPPPRPRTNFHGLSQCRRLHLLTFSHEICTRQDGRQQQGGHGGTAAGPGGRIASALLAGRMAQQGTKGWMSDGVWEQTGARLQGRAHPGLSGQTARRCSGPHASTSPQSGSAPQHSVEHCLEMGICVCPMAMQGNEAGLGARRGNSAAVLPRNGQ